MKSYFSHGGVKYKGINILFSLCVGGWRLIHFGILDDLDQLNRSLNLTCPRNNIGNNIKSSMS